MKGSVMVVFPEVKAKGKHAASHAKIRSENPKFIEVRMAKAEAKRRRRGLRNLILSGDLYCPICHSFTHDQFTCVAWIGNG